MISTYAWRSVYRVFHERKQVAVLETMAGILANAPFTVAICIVRKDDLPIWDRSEHNRWLRRINESAVVLVLANEVLDFAHRYLAHACEFIRGVQTATSYVRRHECEVGLLRVF